MTRINRKFKNNIRNALTDFNSNVKFDNKNNIDIFDH